MAAEFAPGVWDLEKSENFDEYMKALEVGFATRFIGNRAKPRIEIHIDDGTWTITTSTSLTKLEIKFKIGEEFDETTADGRKVRTTCTLNENKLIQEQRGRIDSLIIREFSKDKFLLTLKAKDVTCTREYKRVQ
ncbi:hypothetical protein BsWGS_21230 [Bradybaena similaris]